MREAFERKAAGFGGAESDNKLAQEDQEVIYDTTETDLKFCADKLLHLLLDEAYRLSLEAGGAMLGAR